MSSFLDKLISELKSSDEGILGTDTFGDVFEDMLEEAVFEETHTNVIIHIHNDYNDYVQENLPLYLDDTDGTGMEVYPNNDGDYVFPNVSLGEHTLITKDNELGCGGAWNGYDDFHIINESESIFMVTKQKHEYTIVFGEVQDTTQQEPEGS